MKTRVLDFDVVIVKDPDGGYYAYVPQLPGCYTQGETVEETLENIKEAIELYLEVLSELKSCRFSQGSWHFKAPIIVYFYDHSAQTQGRVLPALYPPPDQRNSCFPLNTPSNSA